MRTSIDLDTLRPLAESLHPRLVEIRRDLHRHPEIAYEEARTAERIRSVLAECEHASVVPDLAGGTGTIAHFAPGDVGDTDTIALRADIDALPIEEASEIAWRSTIPQRMHACGHDGHTAILLGTALALERIASEGGLTRPVTLLFQPAEEGGAGGRRMVEDGALDGRHTGSPVARIYGLHGWPHVSLGTVATKVGPMLAASDRFEIDVTGRGAHAAFPHTGADTVLATAAIVTALQSIVAREVDPLDAAVVSATMMHAGSAFNVIPATATIGGTARSLLPATRDLLERRIVEVAESVAKAHGCTADARYLRGYPVTSNDAGEVERFERIARSAIGDANVVPFATPVMGGEDFSFYGEVVPACFFTLGLRPADATSFPELHAPTFDFNDDAIPTGVELFCRLVLEA